MLNSHIVIFMKVLYHTKSLESCDTSSWQKIYSSMHFFKRDVHIARVFLRNKCNVTIPLTPLKLNVYMVLFNESCVMGWRLFQNRYLRFNYRIFFIRNKVTVQFKQTLTVPSLWNVTYTLLTWITYLYILWFTKRNPKVVIIINVLVFNLEILKWSLLLMF